MFYLVKDVERPLHGSRRADEVYNDVDSSRTGVPRSVEDVLLVSVTRPVNNAETAVLLRHLQLVRLQKRVRDAVLNSFTDSMMRVASTSAVIHIFSHHY